MSDDVVNELGAYISLLVKAAGGRVEIPYDTLVEGLPENERVAIQVPQQAGDPLVFEVVTTDGQSDDA